MKKSLLLVMILCLAASCERGFVPAEEPLRFTAAGSAGDVRVAFSDDLSALNWASGDRIGIYAVKGSETVGVNYPYAATEITGSSATLSAVSSQWQYGRSSVSGCTFQAYAPFTGTAGEGNRFVVPVSVPSLQQQAAAGSVEHLSSYAVLKAFPATANPPTGSVNLRFRNLTAVVELEIKATAASAHKIASAELQAAAPLAFDRGNLLLEGDPDDTGGAFQINDGQDTLTLSLGEPFALTTTGAKISLTVIPGTHAAGSLKLRLVTTTGAEATIAIPDAVIFTGNGIYRKTIFVDPASFKAPGGGGSYIWKKVTTAAEVTTGQYVVRYDFHYGDHLGNFLLPCTPVDRNPIPASVADLNLSFNTAGDLLAAPAGYLWDIAKSTDGWTFSCTDGTATYLLGGCDQAQGIAISTDGKGYYTAKTYSTCWTLADGTSGIVMTVPVSDRKAMPWIDPANGLNDFEWRMTKSDTGGYIFYKKTAVE